MTSTYNNNIGGGNCNATSSKRKYAELKIDGPPLFKQGSILNDFQSPTKRLHSTSCPPLDASKTALLIVDVQPEYWSECPAVRKDFPQFPTQLSSLINNCRTQNCKRIIWVRAAYDYDNSPWLHQFARLHQGNIPPVVRPSSKWEDFATPRDENNEMVITKSSWSSTSGGTGLLDSLKSDGIETVLVCGLITSVCVQHSAFGVFEAGYRTVLVTDACADRGRARHEAAMALYGDYMYELRSVDSVQAEFKKHQQQGLAVGVSLCFDDEVDEEDEKIESSNVIKRDVFVVNKIHKSQSDGSLTSATSHADSVSTID